MLRQSLATLVACMATVGSAQSSSAPPATQVLPEIEQACQLPTGTLSQRGEVVIYQLGAELNPESMRCVIPRLYARIPPGDLVMVKDASQIEAALQKHRFYQDEARLSPDRKAKVARVLAAAMVGDTQSLKEEGAMGLPYAVGARPAQPTMSPFSTVSLSLFRSCTPKINVHAEGWIKAQWRCPRDVQLPWKSTETGFRFEGMAIEEIRTNPGLPLMRLVTTPTSAQGKQAEH
jgi:hypothetical protein